MIHPSPFQFLPKNNKLLLKLPLVKLKSTKQNFVFMATKIWNDLRDKIFDKCSPTKSGIMILGSAINSELDCSIAIKSKLKHNLLCAQKLGDQTMWYEFTTFQPVSFPLSLWSLVPAHASCAFINYMSICVPDQNTCDKLALITSALSPCARPLRG
jgi:hypothetical protein